MKESKKSDASQFQHSAQNKIDEEDSFAIGFYNWMTYNPDSGAYKLLNLPAKELLKIYRDRPFINTDTSKQ